MLIKFFKCQIIPVLSGIEAWSVFLSFLKTILPSCRTDETTLSIAVRETDNINEEQNGHIFKALFSAITKIHSIAYSSLYLYGKS